jgi:hypothetical protein
MIVVKWLISCFAIFLILLWDFRKMDFGDRSLRCGLVRQCDCVVVGGCRVVTVMVVTVVVVTMAILGFRAGG